MSDLLENSWHLIVLPLCGPSVLIYCLLYLFLLRGIAISKAFIFQIINADDGECDNEV